MAAKTVTISRMMELVPAHVEDPTPHLYTSTMHTCAGLLVVALLANSAIKPVAPRFRGAHAHSPKPAVLAPQPLRLNVN